MSDAQHEALIRVWSHATFLEELLDSTTNMHTREREIRGAVQAIRTISKRGILSVLDPDAIMPGPRAGGFNYDYGAEVDDDRPDRYTPPPYTTGGTG